MFDGNVSSRLVALLVALRKDVQLFVEEPRGAARRRKYPIPMEIPAEIGDRVHLFANQTPLTNAFARTHMSSMVKEVNYHANCQITTKLMVLSLSIRYFSTIFRYPIVGEAIGIFQVARRYSIYLFFAPRRNFYIYPKEIYLLGIHEILI